MGGVFAVVAAVFVLYTAMIDPMAALAVVIAVIICLVFFRMVFGKRWVKKIAPTRKVAVKKTAKAKAKKKK